jgi:hypothetical protein
MTDNKTAVQSNPDTIRYVLIGVLLVAAFFGAYKFASASSARKATAAAPIGLATQAGTPGTGAAAAGGSDAGAAAGGCGMGCCGGGSTTAAKPVAGTAKLDAGVQKIDVKVTTVYTPNVIKLKAGVPAEINFSSAQGCTGVVQSTDLGFSEDLTTGPKTVKLQGLKPGTYGFACGMNMVTGQIVVE